MSVGDGMAASLHDRCIKQARHPDVVQFVHLRCPHQLVVCVDAGGLQPVSFLLLNLHAAELDCNPVPPAREYSLSMR